MITWGSKVFVDGNPYSGVVDSRIDRSGLYLRFPVLGGFRLFPAGTYFQTIGYGNDLFLLITGHDSATGFHSTRTISASITTEEV